VIESRTDHPSNW